MNSILGKIVLGEWELGQTSSPVITPASARGRTVCQGFAAVALVVSALGCVHTSGGAVKAVAIRVTQVVAETVYEQTANADILVTQEVAEVVYEQTANAAVRLTQAVLEAVIEEVPSGAGLTRCSGRCAATLALNAPAQGRTTARGCVSALSSTPVKARGRVTTSGQALPGVQRIALIGQTKASGSAWASISQSAQGRATAQGQATATVTLLASAVGLVRTSGSAKAYLSVEVAEAVGVVHTWGWCIIGMAGSGPACLTGHDTVAATIPNFVY